MYVKIICCQFVLYRVVGGEMDSGVSMCKFPVYAQ
jgi:hypothetical protein